MNQDKKFEIRCRGVIVHEGKLLVVKHTHDTTFAALPGGHLEFGEDVQECLRRELVEELGIEPEIGRLLYVNTYIESYGAQPVEFFFEILNGDAYAKGSNVAATHAHELAAVVWMHPSDDILLRPTQFADDFRAGELFADEVRYIKK